MKTIFLSILIALGANLFAQQSDSSNIYLDIEFSIIHPILGGFGGTVGLEKDHFGFGVMGFGTKLNHTTKHYLIEDADSLAVYNWGAELYSDYYFKQNHRRLFLGAVVSLNGFRFTDIPVAQTILVLYAAPRVGYRFVLPKKLSVFYFQPALTVSFKVWDNESAFLVKDIDATDIFLLSHLTIGIKI